jgi:hypothetical protein
MGFVHLDRTSPGTSIDVVLFSCFEIALFLEFLSHRQMGFLEQIRPVLGHQPDHVIILPTLLIHGNGHIELLNNQVHLLSLFPLLLLFELLGLLNIQTDDLAFR